MIAWSNELVDSELESLRSELRKLKADGVKEGELRQQYARISAIQRMRID